jgi:hypothetical protein
MAAASDLGEERWRECSAFLTRVGLLSADHRANSVKATARDLAYTLRDGVQLCRLLNLIQPNSLDLKDINQRPQMAQVSTVRLSSLYIHGTCRLWCPVFNVSADSPPLDFPTVSMPPEHTHIPPGLQNALWPQGLGFVSALRLVRPLWLWTGFTDHINSLILSQSKKKRSCVSSTLRF